MRTVLGPPGLLLAAVLALAGCGGDGGSAPTAPPPAAVPAPPPPPPFRASFAESRLEVREGESVEIEIVWEVRELAAAVELGISAVGEDPSPDEYRLSAETVSIPAGKEVSGTGSLRLDALGDRFFNEGEEVLSLAFAAEGGAAAAALGDPIGIAIAEAGASPCPGVTVRALPWREEEWSAFDTTSLATTLEIELAVLAADTRMEHLGPYFDLYEDGSTPRSLPAFGIYDWRVESGPGGVRHQLEINWPGQGWTEEDTPLEFRFLGTTCSGEPAASCTSEACELPD